MLSRIPIKRDGDPNGNTPIECFVWIDSHGEGDKQCSCTDYEILDRVLKGKENINLQIKMWLEGVLDGTTFVDEVREWTKDYPEWVFKSFQNRLQKTFREKLGFVPRFTE